MRTRGEKVQGEVLTILRRRGEPVSAYDVLGELRVANPKAAPPTVYRALNALIARGRVHRLESMNAYTACQCDRHAQAAILSICDDCGTVEESVSLALLEDLSNVVGKSGFQPSRHVIEVHGLCVSCGAGRGPV